MCMDTCIVVCEDMLCRIRKRVTYQGVIWLSIGR